MCRPREADRCWRGPAAGGGRRRLAGSCAGLQGGELEFLAQLLGLNGDDEGYPVLDGGSGGGLFVGGPGLGAGGELGGAGVVGGVGLVLVAAQLGLALAAGVGEAFDLLQGFAEAGEAAGA